MALTTDSSTNNQQLTANGDVSLNTTTYKYGGGSAYFDGDGDYIQTEIDVGNDFTIEGWVRRVGTALGTIFEIGDINPSRYGMHLAINSSGIWELNDAQTQSISGGSAPLNTWVHFAVIRNNGTNKLYINGVLIGTSSQGFPKQNNIIRIGGAPNYGFYFNGYIDDFQILKGVAKYTQNFTPSQNELPDPYDESGSNVSLLLHMDGTNGSQNFTDSSLNNFTITANGDAQISTAEKKFGSASAYFNGADYINSNTDTAFNLGDGSNYTVELWIYVNSFEGQADAPRVICFENNSDSYGLLIDPGSSNGNLVWNHFGTGAEDIIAPSAITLNTWTHIALVKNGSKVSLYINGVETGFRSDTYAMPNPENGNVQITLGGSIVNYEYQEFYGYIDELRITKGVARYTSNFTPQTAPFPNPVGDPYISNVSLLMHMDGTDGAQVFDDSSINNFTITVNGDTNTSTAIKKIGNASALFDGISDYLQIASQTEFGFGTGDFTIECWIYPTQLSSDDLTTIVDFRDSGGGNGPAVFIENGGSTIMFYDGSDNNSVFGNTVIPLNQWTHVVAQRSSSVWQIYINGNEDSASVYISNNGDLPSSSPCRIGTAVDSPGNYRNFFGYIDELRVTKGVARYSTNFTPSLIEFPNP